MKFICSKNDLLEGINIVQKAVMPKASLPILEGILINANNGVISLTGNCFDIGIECVIQGDVKENGSIVINSKMFGDIVRKLPESEVMISLNDKKIDIDCDNSKFEISGIDSSGFPSLPKINDDNKTSLSQNILKNLIRQTIFAVGLDDNRPILTGTLMKCYNGEITFVSIDGFRLALRKSITKNENDDYSVIIPGKNLNEISKILQNVDDVIDICYTSNQIMFKFENVIIVSKLLEGDFLNYENIIPNDFESIVYVERKMLLESIERASLITNDDKRFPIKISLKDNNMNISCITEIGKVNEDINIKNEGNDIIIGFNPKYLIDALRVIEDETIKLSFTSSIGPCLITPCTGNDYLYLVLPVRI